MIKTPCAVCDNENVVCEAFGLWFCVKCYEELRVIVQEVIESYKSKRDGQH